MFLSTVLAQDLVNPALEDISHITPTGFLNGLIPAILGLIIIVGITAFVILFLMGGVGWASSGGDKAKIERARSRMTQALIGLIILLSFIAILSLFERFFGIGFRQIEVGRFHIDLRPPPTLPPATPPPGDPTIEPPTATPEVTIVVNPTDAPTGTCQCSGSVPVVNECIDPMTATCRWINDCVCINCGDNILQPDESCDDGNTNTGDGCRSDCLMACSDSDNGNYPEIVGYVEVIDQFGMPGYGYDSCVDGYTDRLREMLCGGNDQDTSILMTCPNACLTNEEGSWCI